MNSSVTFDLHDEPFISVMFITLRSFIPDALPFPMLFKLEKACQCSFVYCDLNKVNLKQLKFSRDNSLITFNMRCLSVVSKTLINSLEVAFLKILQADDLFSLSEIFLKIDSH